VAVTDDFEQCVQQAVAAAMAEPDELLRADGLQGISRCLVELRRQVGTEYALAVFQANRAGASYTQLARSLGVNGSRVHQLISQGRDVDSTRAAATRD
jgi:DNA-directed RNA polymerase specialized sigma24 family protein